MHIVEGYLPIWQCLFWFIVSGIVVVYGVYQFGEFIYEKPNYKSVFTLSALLMLFMSFLKFPSVTGSCTHPTGNGLSGAIIGPPITAVFATIILLFESLILGYGGITTIGANIFSWGIFGPFIAFLIYKVLSKFGVPNIVIVIVATFFANFATYFMTSLQLAFAFPGSGIFATCITIFYIFFVTLLPLVIVDCIVSAVVWVIIYSLNSDTFEV